MDSPHAALSKINALAESDWMSTHGVSRMLENLEWLLAEFERALPPWHRMSYLREHLTPRAWELLGAAEQHWEAASAEREREAVGAELAAAEAQQQTRQAPAFVYGVVFPVDL